MSTLSSSGVVLGSLNTPVFLPAFSFRGPLGPEWGGALDHCAVEALARNPERLRTRKLRRTIGEVPFR